MRALSTIVACVLLCGCARQNKPTTMRDNRGQLNIWTIESLNNQAVDNAIIAQRTLYPYHFVPGASALNNLGVRDLRVLAVHLRRNPGQELNIRRGDVTDAVHQARVKAVVDALGVEGVAATTVQIRDGMPGGDGMTARRQELILQRADNPTPGSSGGSPAAGSGFSAGEGGN